MKRITNFLLLCRAPIISTLFVMMIPHTATLAQQSEMAKPDTIYEMSPVIVTATQAHERLSPVTFSNLTQQEIQRLYSVQDIPLLLAELPSITTYSENGNGIGYNYINLRGFDQRRLSIMVNGVPQNDPEDHNVYWIDLPDLMASTENIQVQRGAGSAFYGPPAIGGSVNIVTNPFGQRPGFTLESVLGFQEFGDSSGSFVATTRKYAAAVHSGMIDDRYLLYGRLAKITSDGYRQNSWVDFDSYFLGAVRFDKNMSTRVHFFGGPIEDGLAYYGLPKFVNSNRTLRRQNLVYWEVDSTRASYAVAVPRRPQEIENFSQPHYELLHDWKLSSDAVLHNTLFHYTGDGFFDYDASWADTSMLRIGYTYGIPTSQNPTNTLVRAFVGNRQWGWLPRTELALGNSNLTIGAELRIHRSIHWGKIRFAEGLPANYDPDYRFYEYNGEREILSFYVHELYQASDKLTLMADLQLVRNRYAIENEKYLGNNFSLSYLFLNPRAGINYNFTDEWNGYVSAAYTSREPRLRNLYAAEDSWFGGTPQFAADTTGGIIRYDFSHPLAKPERLLNLELGVAWRNPHARLNANLFWMEFEDELVKSGQVDIFGQPVTGNAERTRHIGIEVDGAWRMVESLTFSGNVTLSRNRLVRYKVIDDNGAFVTLDDNPIAGFPDALANLRLIWEPSNVQVFALMKYVGPFYTDNFKNEMNKNDAYTVFNGGLLYTTPQIASAELTFRLEVRNIFDNLYFTSGEGNAFFPAAERNYLFGITVHL
jgi:iron complex outermembrane receptor protein